MAKLEPMAPPPVKAGYKTTEFWVAIAVVVGTTLTSVVDANILPPKYAAIVASVAAGIYTIVRAWQKKPS